MEVGKGMVLHGDGSRHTGLNKKFYDSFKLYPWKSYFWVPLCLLKDKRTNPNYYILVGTS